MRDNADFDRYVILLTRPKHCKFLQSKMQLFRQDVLYLPTGTRLANPLLYSPRYYAAESRSIMRTSRLNVADAVRTTSLRSHAAAPRSRLHLKRWGES